MKSRAARGRSISALAVVVSAVSIAAFASSCSDSGDPAPNQTDGTGGPTTGTPATNAGPTTDGTVGPTTTGATTAGPTVTSSVGGVTTTGVSVTGTGTTAGVGGTGSDVTTTAVTATTNPDTTGSTSGSTTTGGDNWWFNGPRTPPPLGSWPPPALKLTEVSAAQQPTAIAAPRHDNTRLYFTEKWGAIRLIKDGVLVSEPALDISDAVLEGGPQGSTGTELEHQGKRGLVALAFDPNYETNGRIFVMYTADQGIPGYGTNDHSNLYDDGDMTIESYRRSADNPDKFDPASAELIVQWDKGNCDQCSQHNGGSLEVDVDGFLWASSGDPPPYDAGGSDDPMNLNGKLLKFDISGETVVPAGNYPAGDPMVASIGIRNAYKFSVDRYTGDLYIGDVGENVWEEVTVERYGQGHKNHGWPLREGFQRYRGDCTAENCLEPVFDYEHSGAEGVPGADNCIIGGYVYRGAAIPGLQGAYIYGDYGSSYIRALQIADGQLAQPQPHDTGLRVFMGCFGEDAAGELYVCDYNGGKILRIDAQ